MGGILLKCLDVEIHIKLEHCASASGKHAIALRRTKCGLQFPSSLASVVAALQQHLESHMLTTLRRKLWSGTRKVPSLGIMLQLSE